MENAHQMETTHPSALEGQLEDLKHLLEGNVRCSGSLKPAPDDKKTDRCAELAETITTLQREIQGRTAVKSDLQGRRQNAAMTESSEASTNMYSNVEQKDLIKILKESHEDRIRQIMMLQQDMTACAQRSHVETLEALSRGNR